MAVGHAHQLVERGAQRGPEQASGRTAREMRRQPASCCPAPARKQHTAQVHDGRTCPCNRMPAARSPKEADGSLVGRCQGLLPAAAVAAAAAAGRHATTLLTLVVGGLLVWPCAVIACCCTWDAVAAAAAAVECEQAAGTRRRRRPSCRWSGRIFAATTNGCRCSLHMQAPGSGAGCLQARGRSRALRPWRWSPC